MENLKRSKRHSEINWPLKLLPQISQITGLFEGISGLFFFVPFWISCTLLICILKVRGLEKLAPHSEHRFGFSFRWTSLTCIVSFDFPGNILGQKSHLIDLLNPGFNLLGGFQLEFVSTAKWKLERLQFSTSSLFVKIWSACSCEFKAYFWPFVALYHLLFDLETIGVN